MEIRGKEVDFKISRLKDAAAFESALKNMQRREDGIKGVNMNISELMEKYIGIMRDFFVEATCADVLEGCEDFEEARDAYYEFLEEIEKQKASILNFKRSDIK